MDKGIKMNKINDVSKTTYNEHNTQLQQKINADVEAYLAKGGTIKQCTHLDNASFKNAAKGKHK